MTNTFSYKDVPTKAIDVGGTTFVYRELGSRGVSKRPWIYLASRVRCSSSTATLIGWSLRRTQLISLGVCRTQS